MPMLVQECQQKWKTLGKEWTGPCIGEYRSTSGTIWRSFIKNSRTRWSPIMAAHMFAKCKGAPRARECFQLWMHPSSLNFPSSKIHLKNQNKITKNIPPTFGSAFIVENIMQCHYRLFHLCPYGQDHFSVQYRVVCCVKAAFTLHNF